MEEPKYGPPISISRRKLLSIINYCHVTRSIYGEEYKSKALDYAINQNLLPLLSGHGETYKNRLAHILEVIPITGYVRSRNKLNKIISTGEHNYESYTYFC